MKERTEKDIWRHLDEFYLVETTETNLFSDKYVALQMDALEWPVKTIRSFGEKVEQALTHQVINSLFFLVDLYKRPDLPANGRWVPQISLKEIAFPGTINLFLNKSGYDNHGLFNVWGK